MGVVDRPIPEKNFDGQVHLERVSKTTTVKKMISHQNFGDDVIINADIKAGGDLHCDGMTVDEIREVFSSQYALVDVIVEHIEFQF